MNSIRFVLLIATYFGVTYGYTVVNNMIYDPTGQQIAVYGVSRPGFEWSATGDSNPCLADYANMKSWGFNVVRLPMNQAFWLPTSPVYAASYKSDIDQQVRWIESLGMGVILDLHWSQAGSTTSSGAQQLMADQASLEFWTQVAAVYGQDPWVMFELYNEPHDIPWSVWRDGGPSGAGWTVAGMQTMYDAVRATGAQNLIIVCGLNWAYDLSGISEYALSGNNIAYSTHVYDFPGKQPSDWPVGFGFAATQYAVIATEFGEFSCNPGFVTAFVQYASQLKISWVGWAWYVSGCAFPSLIADWNGSPTTDGKVVKQALPLLHQVNGASTANPGTSITPVPSTVPPTTTSVVNSQASNVSCLAIIGSGSSQYWLSLMFANCPAISAVDIRTVASFPTWLAMTWQTWGHYTLQPSAPLIGSISLRLTYTDGSFHIYNNLINVVNPGNQLPLTSSSGSGPATNGSSAGTTSAPTPPAATTLAITVPPITTKPSHQAQSTTQHATVTAAAPTTLQLSITQHAGSSVWWLAIHVDSACVRGVKVRDSSIAQVWQDMSPSTWGYYIWTSSGKPLVPPLSLDIISSSGQQVTYKLGSILPGNTDVVALSLTC